MLLIYLHGGIQNKIPVTLPAVHYTIILNMKHYTLLQQAVNHELFSKTISSGEIITLFNKLFIYLYD